MSEVSLKMQIEQIQVLLDYIKLSVFEVEKMRTEMDQWIAFLRQNGLTKEFADAFEGPLYMGHIYSELDNLMERISTQDYRYLEDVKRNLENLL